MRKYVHSVCPRIFKGMKWSSFFFFLPLILLRKRTHKSMSVNKMIPHHGSHDVVVAAVCDGSPSKAFSTGLLEHPAIRPPLPLY